LEKKKKSSKVINKSSYFFLLTYLFALFVLVIIFRPFLFALILGGVLGVFFFPLNKILINKGLKPNVSALILVFLILILIILSAFLFINSLVKEASATYQTVRNYDFEDVDSFVESFLGLNISSKAIITPLIVNFNNSLESSVPNIVNSLTDIFVGLFVMLFLLFYIFKDGDNLLKSILDIIPVSDNYKDRIKTESSKMLYGIMYGQFLIAVIQGFLGGLAFVVFGLNNPVFWGFVMGILAFIPMLGTPAVWAPAGIILIANGEVFNGVGLLLFGVFVMFTIENIVRPRIIGRRSGMHPLLVLLSIFGGLKMFGVIGLLAGPIIVTLCVLVIKFFNEELAAQNKAKS
jgi:predicted PurR-regulated permease PerM